jgi:iron complex outermembrane receptor protein
VIFNEIAGAESAWMISTPVKVFVTDISISNKGEMTMNRSASYQLFNPVIIATAMFIIAMPANSFAQALEEIIVTAQKREQDLQEVSIAVTVVTMDRIETNHVVTLEDLQYIAPSLSFGHALGVAKVYIRGIGLNDQTAGIDPSVALHVDGAVINDPTAHFVSLFDLERVEILRGPQGILYGRNATGGSVNLITAKPTQELDGYARVSVGDYSEVVVDAAISGPISEMISGRLAVHSLTRDGYGINEATGTDVDDADQQGFRAHLQFDFNDNISYLLTGEWYEEDDHALGSKFKRATFPIWETDPTLTPAEAASLRPLGIDPLSSGPDYPAGIRNYASEWDPVNQKETLSGTGTLNWTLNDNLTIVNITNYRDVDGFFTHDFDGSEVLNRYDVTGQPPTIHSREIGTEQWTNELQLVFDSDRWNGLVAYYYFQTDQFVTNRSGVSPYGGLPVPGLTRQRVFLTGTGEAKSWSLFGNFTFDINDQFAVKFGARYTEEKRSLNNNNFIQVFRNPPFVPGVPTPLDTLAPFPIPPPDRFGVPVGFRGNFPLATQSLQDSLETDDFSPMLGVEWRPSDSIMLYYTYSEGFKSAVGQLGQTAAGVALPEEIDNHELGAKTTLLDGSMLLNFALFSYDLENLQLARTLPAGGGGSGFVNIFENAAQVGGNGAEVEMYWQATEAFSLTAGLSWLDVEFDQYDTVDNFDPCLVLASCVAAVQSYAGNSTRNTPDFAYNLHGAYEIPMGNGASITMTADVSYKDEQFFSEVNNSVERTDEYTLFDASLTYRSADDRWSAGIWGKNITDEFAEAGSFTVSLSRTVGALYLAPRTYGATFAVNF